MRYRVKNKKSVIQKYVLDLKFEFYIMAQHQFSIKANCEH